jgi:hypothetical protein
MKSLYLTRLIISGIIGLLSFPLSGQNLETTIQAHGRKSLPEPNFQYSSPGINTDAPAGSISVAEDPVYNAYTPEQLVQNVLVTGALRLIMCDLDTMLRAATTGTGTTINWSSTPGNRQMAYFKKATSTFPLDEVLS